MEWVIFIPAAALALAGGVGVIAARQPVHSALALLVVLASLAVTYLLLAAQFIAVLQVIIYAGAIVVLFLFVIMLLHTRSGEERREKLPRQRSAAAVAAAVFLGALLTGALSAGGLSKPVAPEFGTAQHVGEALFVGYLLPFELASVILLVGIVAAVILGQRHPPAQRAPGARPADARHPTRKRVPGGSAAG
ncbi:MAG: NADH-quinone oxidoreductase subunit J family protein [Armatimonadota bacterium]